MSDSNSLFVVSIFLCVLIFVLWHLLGALRADIPAKLTSEIDGLRVITSQRHDFVFRVSDALVDTCPIGSTTVGPVFAVKIIERC